MTIRPMAWDNGTLRLLDQRELPAREVWLELHNSIQVAAAIRDMAVRGAPAIGVAAAYGMALAAQGGEDRQEANQRLAESRPTAVNLFWALDRISTVPWEPALVLREAQNIEVEDVAMNQAIGRHGADLVPQGAGILTICNTGSLATAGHGTALGIIRTAYEQGKVREVFSCESRPRQQGLKLTAWELKHDDIPFRAIADGAAGSLMRTGLVSLVVAGADRIAANGDSANKIGTYSLAVLAARHGIQFYIAAPSSTLDPNIPDGSHIPIEERDAAELTHVGAHLIAPEGIKVWNPAFDVTPADLITAIVTEKGVHKPPYRFEKG